MAATAFPDRKKHHQAPRMAPVILLRHPGKRKWKDSGRTVKCDQARAADCRSYGTEKPGRWVVSYCVLLGMKGFRRIQWAKPSWLLAGFLGLVVVEYAIDFTDQFQNAIFLFWSQVDVWSAVCELT